MLFCGAAFSGMGGHSGEVSFIYRVTHLRVRGKSHGFAERQRKTTGDSETLTFLINI